VDRCRRHRNEAVSLHWQACVAYTPALDCLTCGACCREAYHSVEVGPRDPFVRLHPERVSTQDGRLVVTREGSRCACLAGELGGYHCVVYADRPRTCRDFPQGGQSCVEARRRVGLTA
jgi:Fe-S-cluster containining protein